MPVLTRGQQLWNGLMLVMASLFVAYMAGLAGAPWWVALPGGYALVFTLAPFHPPVRAYIRGQQEISFWTLLKRAIRGVFGADNV